MTDEREWNKTVCVHAVVVGQTCLEKQNAKAKKEKDKLDRNDFLATISSKCSRWASDLAREDGLFDYYQAYGDEDWFHSRREVGNNVTSELTQSICMENRPYPYEHFSEAVKDATKALKQKNSKWKNLKEAIRTSLKKPGLSKT